MKDREALNILMKDRIYDISEFSAAVAHAGWRLFDCQWHDYVENDPAIIKHLCGVLLDIKFEDGSRGTYSGHGRFNDKIGWYFELDDQHKTCFTEKAVIEHWMANPTYREG